MTPGIGPASASPRPPPIQLAPGSPAAVAAAGPARPGAPVQAGAPVQSRAPDQLGAPAQPGASSQLDPMLAATDAGTGPHSPVANSNVPASRATGASAGVKLFYFKRYLFQKNVKDHTPWFTNLEGELHYVLQV